MSGRRSIGIALLIGGVILLAFGLDASNSFASDVTEAFTGSPSDRTMWMIVGGSAAAVAGLLMAMVPGASR
jgi:ABC-type enterochelin transport system permease subunit